MFNNINPEILNRMRWLEEEDYRDRRDGTSRPQRLRQIPRKTGQFLSIMCANAPHGEVIEIGTSGGYSTLWLALACIETGSKVTTFEISDDKAKLAQETFEKAGVVDYVNLYHGNAIEMLENYSDIGFCFLDSEKKDYEKLYDMVIPRLVPGGILIADNMISHAETLGSVAEKANNDNRIDSVIVPIGKGELLCRKI